MNSKWSDSLRKQMESHSEPAPDGLWDNIEQAIIKNKAEVTHTGISKVISWSTRFKAVAAAVVALLLMGDYSYNRYNEIAASEIHFKDEQQKDASVAIQNSLHSTEHKFHLPAVSIKRAAVPDVQPAVIAASAIPKDTVGIPEPTTLVLTNNYSSNADTSGFKSRSCLSKKKGNQEILRNIDFNQLAATDLPKTNDSKWAATVYAINLGSSGTDRDRGYASLAEGKTPIDVNDEDTLSTENKPYESIILKNKNSDVYTSIKHRQPISFGISLSYHINDRVSIKAGVVYTNLTSTLRSGSDSYYYSSKQTLHYIGIPVNISYQVFSHKPMSLYLTGGVLAEKNVSGTLVTDYIVDMQKESSIRERIKIAPFQWSLNASTGVQYSLLKNVGVYAEPGISYYFRNSSKNETIYKEKPLNFSFRVGFLINLNN